MNIIAAILLAVFAGAFRLLPHPANFTPIGALMMFLSARYTKGRGIFIVLGAMFLSDAVIGFYNWRVMLAVYGSFAATALTGRWMKQSASLPRIAAGSLASSSLFFIVTNFATWFYSGTYAHTAAGLFSAYALGIPFFRNMLLGDFFFAAVFFGAHELVRKRSTAPPWRGLPALSPVKINPII